MLDFWISLSAYNRLVSSVDKQDDSLWDDLKSLTYKRNNKGPRRGP